MAEMLLINPRKRRKARKAAPAKRRRSSAKRRRNPIANLGAHSPVRRMRRRRANPVAKVRSRRRRNPINLGGRGAAGIMGLLKDAAIGGAGALAVDVAMGKVNPYLPEAMRTNPNTVGLGDLVKAGLTVMAGKLLNKVTKGISMKAARGALTTQVRDILSLQLPSTMTLGYASPAKVIPGTARVGPNVIALQNAAARAGLAAYQRQGTPTPMLNAYQRQGGPTPMLSNSRRIMQREGVQYR
jgi:hypothetical protein